MKEEEDESPVASWDGSTIDMESQISNMLLKLIQSQEGLGEEFERVLFNNAWDLYEE